MSRKDEFTTDLYWLARLAVYSGYECIKVERKIKTTAFSLLIPEMDQALLQEEFHRSDTAVYLKQWCEAIKTIDHLRKKAKENMGCWTSPSYLRN